MVFSTESISIWQYIFQTEYCGAFPIGCEDFNLQLEKPCLPPDPGPVKAVAVSLPFIDQRGYLQDNLPLLVGWAINAKESTWVG